jgi:hypothetical protein
VVLDGYGSREQHLAEGWLGEVNNLHLSLTTADHKALNST